MVFTYEDDLSTTKGRMRGVGIGLLTKVATPMTSWSRRTPARQKSSHKKLSYLARSLRERLAVLRGPGVLLPMLELVPP
jgi:hypothetical protein